MPTEAGVAGFAVLGVFGVLTSGSGNDVELN
jgi:hypothetical protein